MNTLLEWLMSPEWAQAVKALLHTLWQGALAALVLGAVFRFVVAPTVRYRCAMAALACVLAAGVLTWALASQPNGARRIDAPLAATAPAAFGGPSEAVSVPAGSGSGGPTDMSVAPTVKWTGWLALCWIAGATLMLVRAGFQVAGAERLRRSTRPLEDRCINQLVEDARAAMHLTRRVRVALTEKLTSPAVVGVLVPTLILPLSLVTTLTPEQLRFVLLHELAHIRRGDYLANLFQLLTEALLFFNPAVWWISHQVRREREACCDALATGLSGAPVDYARTLVHVAERFIPAPAAAPAFGNRRAPSSLAERVQRLLVPGYRPSLRLTWRAMLLSLSVGTALLFLSAAATRVTVAAILTPQERMARIEKKMIEYGVKPLKSADGGKRGKVLVKGHVRMADGAPAPKAISLRLFSSFGDSSGSYSAAVQSDGTFSNVVGSGSIWLEAHVEGHAPAVKGPLDGAATNMVDAGELVMSRGFEVFLTLIDTESGALVTNGTVKTAFILPESGFHLQMSHTETPDASGRVTLPLCVDQPLQVTINAAGYEISQRQFSKLSPRQNIEIKLRTGRAFAGTVIDQQTGEGISGATIQIIHESAENDRHYNWDDTSRVLARADRSGRFTITQLRHGVKYWLGVSAPGYASVLTPASGGDEIAVKLGPELVVRGRVIGSLDSLQKINKQPALYVSTSEEIGNSSFGSGDWVTVRTANGAATFQFTNRVAGPVTLSGAGYSEKRRVDAPVNDWVVNLAEATNTATQYTGEKMPKREVIFRFTHASGVSPSGTARVVVPENVDPNNRTSRNQEIAITNGEVRVQIAIGGHTSIEPARMPGYWFDSRGRSGLSHILVTNGEGPLLFEVPLVPAGAIYATARNADGTPAGGLFFGIVELERAPARGEHGTLGNSSDSVSGDAPRKWVSGPLPLGGIYQVYGWRRNTFSVSRPIKLTEANPDAEVELKFGATRVLEGKVLNATGEPVRDARFEPNFSLRNGHGFGLRPVFTDERGRFRLEEATPEMGEYSAIIEAPGSRAERVKIVAGTQPQVIQLRPGKRLAGRVVEDGTGHVLPDTDVRLVDLESLKLPELKTRTDANGWFEFTSLGDVNYTMFVDAGTQVLTRKFRGDLDTNVTVAVKLYSWSKVKPKPMGDRAEK